MLPAMKLLHSVVLSQPPKDTSQRRPYDRVLVHGSFVIVLRNQDIDVLDSTTLKHVRRLERAAQGLETGPVKVSFCPCMIFCSVKHWFHIIIVCDATRWQHRTNYWFLWLVLALCVILNWTLESSELAS